MADKFSIVIVCKNEVDTVEQLLNRISNLSDDIIIYDNGSTDGTLDKIQNYNVRIYQGEWLGYGKTKQEAVKLATYDWVLSIDADEIPDEELQAALKQISFSDNAVYEIKFKNFLGKKYLRWGEWGGDKHVRIFNKNFVNWNDAVIHEELIIQPTFTIHLLPGHILHYTMKDNGEYSHKMVNYALLNAEKYFALGKKATWVKRFLNPPFTFIKNYFFLLGFLDGWEGFVAARMTSFYTFLKYARLHELWQTKK